MDSFTEREQTGCLSNLGGAVMGVFIAPIVLLAASWGMFANEKHALNVSQGLAQGKGEVVHVDSAKVDASHEGKLVHTNGTAASDSDLSDTDLALNVGKALRLDRKVEMFQWTEDKKTETRKKLGGGTEKTTTYTYNKEWSDHPVDSNSFKQSNGHQNPSFPMQGRQFAAKPIHVGAFTLPDKLVDELSGGHDASVPSGFTPKVTGFKVEGNQLVRGSTSSPQVGDTRISWKQIDSGEVSLLGQQSGSTLAPFRTKQNTEIFELAMGNQSSDAMFASAESSNQVFTWIIRAVCWIVAMVAFGMLLGPLEAVANVIPFLGDLVGAGTGLFAFLMGSAWTMLVIALAWIAARPLLGGLLLAGVIGAAVMVYRAGRGRRRNG